VVYDGPAVAIRAALSVLGGPHGRETRLGLQIAEVPRAGPVVDGPGVETAVGLADRAAPGQLLVSATVHDLVGGSGLPLEPAGDDAYRLPLPAAAP
jgi:class 3 adenylate cyclase